MVMRYVAVDRERFACVTTEICRVENKRQTTKAKRKTCDRPEE
jgi:hypothetical protein